MPQLAVFTVMLPDLTPEQAAPALRSAGFDGVEWRVTHIPDEARSEVPSFWGNNLCTFAPTPDDAARAQQITAGAELAMVGIGTYVSVDNWDGVETAMQFAYHCGAPQVRVQPGRWPTGDDRSFAQAFEDARECLADVQALAKQYRRRAVVEIHHGTLIPSASLAARLVEGFDPRYIGVIHDVGNMAREGYEEYRIGLELLGPYLSHVHVKNARYVAPANGSGLWRAVWSPLEDGVVDFPALFQALYAIGYDGWISLENFSGARPSLETLQHDGSFLREHIQQVWGS